MAHRISVAYRVTEKTLKLIVSLSEILGLSKTSVVEMAVRELARRNKIKA